MPYMLDDPAAMTPEARRREIAAILARGVLRLRRIAERARDSRPFRTSEESAESVSYSLEVGAKARPHAPVIEGGMDRQKGAGA